jgi:hypothetical protein
MRSQGTYTYDDPGLGRDYGLQLIYIDLGLFLRLVDIIGLVERGGLAVARLG